MFAISILPVPTYSFRRSPAPLRTAVNTRLFYAANQGLPLTDDVTFSIDSRKPLKGVSCLAYAEVPLLSLSAKARSDEARQTLAACLAPKLENWKRSDQSLAVTKEHLSAPSLESEMTSHAVGYDVNHPKIDYEHLARRVEPNLGVTRNLF